MTENTAPRFVFRRPLPEIVVIKLHRHLENPVAKDISHLMRKRWIPGGTRTALVDFSRLRSMDNELDMINLADWIEAYQEVDGKVAFCGLSSTLEETFRIMGLGQFIRFYSDEAAALADLVSTKN